MTDGWDERTEAIPGTRDDKSFEIDLDLGPGGELRTPAAIPAVEGPLLVVFEPAPLGIAPTLMKLGYVVVAGNTGVDVMSLVAARGPRAVVCAPAPDAERRRLLAAALRLRFPHVPIVYVSSHAGHEEAVLGALREGASAVLSWPLPGAAEIDRVLGPFLRVTPPSLEVAPSEAEIDTSPTFSPAALSDVSTGPVRMKAPASEEGGFLAQRTLVTSDEEDPVPEPSSPRPVPLPVSVLAGPAADAEMDVEPTTQPNLRPVAHVGLEAAKERRGEIGELLAAISPFLWSLEDAARWATELGDKGDPIAKNHARALHLLAKILAQLQARIDETGA